MTLGAIARGSVLIALANLIPRAGAFLLLPVFTQFLSRAEFGVLSLASSTSLLLAIAYRLGLDGSLLRMHDDVSQEERRSLYATVVGLTLACVVIATVIGAAIVLVVVADRESAWLGPIAAVTLAIAALNTFQYVPSVWFRATGRPGRYLLVALAGFGAVAAVTVGLVVFAGFCVVGSLVGQFAGASVVASAAFAVLWSHRPWRLSGVLARRSLRFGLPLLPHGLAGWLLNVSDRWLLGLLLGIGATEALTEIGVYSLGYQLGYAIGLAAISFNAAWLPVLYRVGDGKGGATVLREATTVVSGAFIALSAGLAIAAPHLIGLIAPAEWAAAADVAAVVGFASAANAAALMFASGIYLARTTGVMPLLTVIAAAANITFNLILIPVVGIMGAAWATLAAYVVLAVVTALVAERRRRVGFDWRRLAVIALIGAAAAVASRIVSPDERTIAVVWQLTLVVGSSVAIAVALMRPATRLRAALAR